MLPIKIESLMKNVARTLTRRIQFSQAYDNQKPHKEFFKRRIMSIRKIFYRIDMKINLTEI